MAGIMMSKTTLTFPNIRSENVVVEAHAPALHHHHGRAARERRKNVHEHKTHQGEKESHQNVGDGSGEIGFVFFRRDNENFSHDTAPFALSTVVSFQENILKADVDGAEFHQARSRFHDRFRRALSLESSLLSNSTSYMN